LPKRGFLNGGGDMGERIRAHDWSATPLGRAETWPAALRSAVSICLGSAFPTAVYWGPELRLLYNDAWAPIPGERHPSALGRPAAEVWADIWPVVGPQLERVLATGEGFSTFDQLLRMQRAGRVHETYWNYSFTPIRDEDGTVLGVLNQGNETTDRVLGLRRQEFKLRLEDALRHLSDPREIMAAAAESLGRHLGANRVGYGEVQADDETVALDVCWANGVEPLSGRYSLNGFGPEDIARQRQGLPQSSDDVLADPRQDPAVWTAIDTRAYASVPLLRNGRFTASLYVNFRDPHRWSEEEIALMEEVGARTWEAVERARAEDRRRESEERFRNLADHAPVMMWVTDPTGACTYLNRSWYEFTGQTPEEAEGFGWLEAIHPDDRTVVEQVFREANAARRDFRLEYRLRRRDGAYRWAIDAAAPRFAPSGEFLGYVGSVIDIDERRSTETALRESEERLRLAAAAAAIGTWDLDLVTGAGHWDEAALRIGGLEGDPGLYDETTWLRLVHPDDRDRVGAAFLASLEPGGPRYDVEFRGAVPAPDGGIRWVTSHGAVLRDPETGRATRAVGIIGDATARHRQEGRLRESEARLRTITNAVPAFVWFATPDGRLHYLNDRWYEYTGQTEAEALPDGWARVLHPDDAERTAATWADARARGVTYEIEVRYRRRDGAYRWYVARAEPLRGSDGEVTTWFGTSTDIHERRQAIERLELALDSGAIQGTWVWDVPGERITADERFAHTFGLDAEECRAGFPVERALAAIHDEDRERVRQAIADAFAGDGEYGCEHRVRNADGAYRWVEARGRVEFAADGTPLRFAGVAVDVEARRAVEAERDRANSLLQAFFETLPGAAYAKDAAGRILLGNPGFATAVGHPPAAFLGKTDLELLADRDRAREIMANDRRVMEEGVTRQVEEDLILPDGRLTQWLSIKTPLRDAQGGVVGLVGVSLEMTERRQAEERMRLLAREVDHRAKNLLGVVQSVVQLTRGTDLAAFKAAVAGRIQALARAHSLLAESRWQGVSIEALVREELAPFSRAGGERIRASGPTLRLWPAASQALALVLHELATNAAKYGALSAEAGVLDVSWRLAGSDRGRRLELAWEERGGPPVAPPSREGFGSTVMRSSVGRQLGGEIAFDWAPGGLRCRIILPADQLGVAAEEARAELEAKDIEPPDITLSGRRILIVEDEALISLELEAAVSALGGQVVGPAASAEAALDLIKAGAPDLAVLDINLGGQSSGRVARALRALDIPFVHCTGYAEPAAQLEAGVEIVGKPVEPQALARAFRRLEASSPAKGARSDAAKHSAPQPRISPVERAGASDGRPG
jgi:PAS domain S-box-containing protein